MTDSENRTYQRYHEEDVCEGEIYRKSPITGNTYRVTRWVEKGEDRVIALEKELVDDGA